MLRQLLDSEGRHRHCTARGVRLGRLEKELSSDLGEALLDPHRPTQGVQPLGPKRGELAEPQPCVGRDVGELLAEGYRDRSVTRVAAMNEAGQLVGRGTGGALLLTPLGPMQPPLAPSNLTAIPHATTWTQPWNSIFLEWDDNSTTEEHFRIERRLSATTEWTAIKETVNLSYHDTEVELGLMYDYRVFAVGLGGDSAPSNIATATAPGTAPDTQPPVVEILKPAAGEKVSGRVKITVAVADNRGVEFLDVETRINSSDVLICRINVRGAASRTERCTWNARGVPLGTYVLEAWAYDALGNYVSVELVAKQKGKPGR